MNEQVIIHILNASKKGDSTAFRKLVEYFQSYVFSLAMRFLGNEEDAKDVTQESFIRVWKHLKKYDSKSKFTTWLYKIVSNLCFDRLKTNARRQNIFSQNDFSMMHEKVDDSNLEQDAVNTELIETIKNLARELTPQQRMVFVLSEFQELDIKEIAKILSISKGSVKSNLYYARKNIRAKLVMIDKVSGE